jgi:hypothetical protein
MKGPCIILEDTNLIQQLSLSEEQVTNMQEVSEEYEYFLGELRHRSLGLQIATLRPRSDSDLQSELKSVFHVLKEVEKDEDYEILVLLQPEQKALWKKLCGTPMSIDWKAPESIGDFDVF